MHPRLNGDQWLTDLVGNAPVLEMEERLSQVMQAPKADLSAGAALDHPMNLEDALHLARTGLRSRVLPTDSQEFVDEHGWISVGHTDNDVPIETEPQSGVDASHSLPGVSPEERGRLK